jgi:hypothetical protein
VTNDEEEGGEPEKSRLCMQMVPVEANNIVQGLHTLYDWGSTVTLVRGESMRRLGFRPAQVAQRIVNGFGGAAVPITGCHFLLLIDVRGNHQVICTFEVEEITTMAETRLPPWAKEVFPSVRVHMPWMDTPGGPIELLIGLDNLQWLPVRLEDSKEPSVNMRLMKSSFGHQYMVMGGWGTALYPWDESMRYRGDPPGSRLTHAEMAQKIRLERCFRGRPQPGAKSGGRMPIKGPSPVRERATSDYGPIDPMQRLALMIAVMVLGMPQVYSCNIATGREVSHVVGHGHVRTKDLSTGWIWERDWNLSGERTVGHEAMEEAACGPLHGNAVIPVLHVRTRRPDEESKVREVPATLWSAAGRVLGGTEEWQVEDWRNGVPRDGEPDEKSHGRRRRMPRGLQAAGQGPGRKVVQVLMEVLVEEDWIWWNADKNQVATKTGKLTTVPQVGEAILEDGLWVWKPGDDGPILARVGEANLPIDGGGTASKN